MCPDPNLLSVYMDEELPSPWKEKMETHLAGCSACREKFDSFKQLLARKDESQIAAEQEKMEAAKERVWQNLLSQRSFQHSQRSFQHSQRNHTGSVRHSGFWQRKLSIPLPAAAAAAVVIMFMMAMWFHGGQINNNGFAQQFAEPAERTGFFLAAEEEMPGIMPVADISGVLQFLASDGTDIIILQLPENRSFSKTGEPAMIRAADYTRHISRVQETPIE